MAASSYEESLRRLFAHEGGYSNHPSDPGGPTNFGITIADYRKFVKPDATAADVRAMTRDEAKRIYRAKYWDAQRCDELPAGVDYAVFDYGVNSGTGRSGKVLRRVLTLPDNRSAVTDAVIAAARAADAKRLVGAICDERLRFLQSLKTWRVFGKGWARRVAEVKAAAMAMTAGMDALAPATGMTDARASQHGSQGENVMWARIKASFRHSLTIAWARAMAFAGLVLAAGEAVLQDPHVTAAMQAALQPRYIPYYVIAIGLVTEIVRRRTAGRA